MSVRDELYIEELHASVNELEQELETTHRANKMLSDEKEKNRQEYIKLYQKIEALQNWFEYHCTRCDADDCFGCTFNHQRGLIGMKVDVRGVG